MPSWCLSSSSTAKFPNAIIGRFKGNNYTSRDKVEQFLLYRCVELTDRLGYDHFVVVDQDTLDIEDPLAQVGAFPHNYYAMALVKVYHQPDHL